MGKKNTTFQLIALINVNYNAISLNSNGHAVNPCASIKESYTLVNSGQKCQCKKNGHKNRNLGSTDLTLVSF